MYNKHFLLKVLFILGVFIEFSLNGCVSWICSNLKSIRQNTLEVKRNRTKRDRPKGTSKKGPVKKGQDPKWTMTKRAQGPKGTMAKREQGPKGTMAKWDQDPNGTITLL